MNLLHIKYHIKKNSSFSKFFNQVKIIAYFKLVAINQIKTINQSSKTSNSRNFQQHTFAKSNRVKFTSFVKGVFEKSIILLYKISIFSRLFTSKISSILSYKLLVISDRLFRSSISRTFFNNFVLCHNCRICNDTFESNNDLHRHLRIIHFNQTFRSNSKNLRKHDQERDCNLRKLENS